MATLTQVYRQATQPDPIQAGDLWVRPDGSADLCIEGSGRIGGAAFAPPGSASAAIPVDGTQATSVLTSNDTNPADGDTVTLGTAGQGQGPRTYTMRTDLTPATVTVTTAATAVADGDTITINGVTYRFKDTLAQSLDVKRSATAGTNLTNLGKAIRDDGIPDTDYQITSADGAGAAAHATVTSGTLDTDHIVLTALQAGSIGHYAVSAASAGTVRLTFSTPTLIGGVDDEVLIGADADATLLNLARLLNGTGAGEEGVDYSRRGTTSEADPNVSASTSVTAHAVTITARAVAGGIGTDGNTLSTVSAAEGTNTLTFTGATLAGGVTGTRGVRGQTSTDGTYLYVCVAPNTWKKLTLSAL